MSLFQNLRFAGRMLRKNPGFTAVAVLTLGLGIGANTAIFSVINAVLLRPLPYPESGRLVTINHFYPAMNLTASVSVPGYLAYRDQKDVFEKGAVETGWVPTLTGRGDPVRIQAVRVTGDWFAVHGVTPALGRGIVPDEEVPGTHTVVLSQGFWQRVLGGDPAAVGQSLLLDGEAYQVVGVMPPGFRDHFNRTAELWVPLGFTPAQMDPNRWTNEFLAFTGRLKPGVSVEEAQRRIGAYGERLKADTPDRFSSDWGLRLQTLQAQATGRIRPALLFLFGAVFCVLLIACANVANLLLARAAGRSREIAVRVALGASPGTLVRQLLTESTLLGLLGGGLGLVLAVVGVPALLSLNPSLPTSGDLTLDAPLLGFTLLVSVLTGVVFGLAPALRVARSNLHDTLKEGSRGAAGDLGGLNLRRGLVVATVALALTLLVGAGLLVRSFSRLVGVDPGFRPDHLLTFNVALPTAAYPNDTVQAAAFARISEGLRVLPGVTGVGATQVLPFGGNWATASFTVEGFQPADNAPGPWGDQRVVTPGFLPTLGATLLRGRQFTEQDNAGAPPVTIVDQEMVRRYWPDEDPIGKRITFSNASDPNATWITVVGVVGHTMHEGLDGDRRVQLYYPIAQAGSRFMAFVLRTTGNPTGVVGPAKEAIRRVDPNLAVSGVETMEGLIDGTLGPRRFSMALLAIFSTLAVTLAAIGLYGVMSFTVTQRSRELGVRLALGAAPGQVLRLVLGQGMRLVVVGLGLGLLLALLLSRLISQLLFDVSPTDPVTFVAISALLVVVTLLATWLPARRATRVDPNVVLREE